MRLASSAPIDQPNLVHIINAPFLLTPIFRGQGRYMRERGLESLFVTAPGKQLDAFALDENVPVREVPIARTISPLRDAKSVFRVWRWLRKLRPKIVHAHTPKGGLIGMLAGMLARVPIRVYHIHGLPFDTARGIRRQLLWLTEAFACRAAHRVFCVSNSMRDIAIRHKICSADKIVVLEKGSANGIDAIERFSPDRIDDFVRRREREKLGIPPDAKVIGFAGRVNRDKGIVELADAWQKIRQQCPEAHLLLVGPRDKKDAVPQKIFDQLDADPRVHSTGYRADTPALYAAMDVFVLPSYREGLPTVVLESMAMGLPVVATRIPGCVDVIDHQRTGTLIAPQDAGQLATAVIEYLGNAFLRCQHGKAARHHVLEHFGQERLWRATLSQYNDLLRAHSPEFEFTDVSDIAANEEADPASQAA